MFAVRYPERVRSLVLLACGGHLIKDSKSGPGAPKSAPIGQSPGPSTKIPSSAKDLELHPSAITERIDLFFRDYVAEALKTGKDETLSGFIATFAYWLPPAERKLYVKHAFFASNSQVPDYWITGWYRDTAWMQIQTDHKHPSSEDWTGGGSAPMLILQGKEDKAAPVKNAVQMKEEYPNRVTLHIVPDAGHAMLAEQPKFIIDHVIPYLRRHPIVR